MSGHLPECYKEDSTDSCICSELRACEQRVLMAAREAVDGLPVYDDHGALKPFKPDTAVVYVMDALAAIDALRGEA